MQFLDLGREVWELGAFWPVYNQMGDVTLVLWKNGEFDLLPTSASRLLKSLAASLAVDLRQVREIYGREVARKLLVPLALHDQFLLVPLKVRTAVIPGDEVYGYFDLSCIQGLQVSAEGVTELIVAGCIISLRQRLRSVEEQLNRARHIEWLYQLRMVERRLPIWLGRPRGTEQIPPAELRRIHPSGELEPEKSPDKEEGTRAAPSTSSNQTSSSNRRST
ncbi:MAG TPA: hypothetical protein GX517_06190 [Alicyclobacillus sp.]|nr:hypothetical protein [Alicyclobacillus sp.]